MNKMSVITLEVLVGLLDTFVGENTKVGSVEREST